jgi:hypothetical protein
VASIVTAVVSPLIFIAFFILATVLLISFHHRIYLSCLCAFVFSRNLCSHTPFHTCAHIHHSRHLLKGFAYALELLQVSSFRTISADRGYLLHMVKGQLVNSHRSKRSLFTQRFPWIRQWFENRPTDQSRCSSGFLVLESRNATSFVQKPRAFDTRRLF